MYTKSECMNKTAHGDRQTTHYKAGIISMSAEKLTNKCLRHISNVDIQSTLLMCYEWAYASKYFFYNDQISSLYVVYI